MYYYSVRRARRWDDVPVEEILEDYPNGIFNSPDPHSRHPLSIDEVSELPQVDDGGRPIHLYCEKGYPIQRRMAVFRPHAPTYGALFKSEKMQLLFTRNMNDIDDEQGGPQSTQVPFTFYPQAGLRSVGHFQAGGLIAACYPVLLDINKSIFAASQLAQAPPAPRNTNNAEAGSGNPGSGDEEEAAGAGPVPVPIPVPYKATVHPISSQGYNAVTHNTRGRRAQHHEVQTGRVTGALAGAWADKNNTNIAWELVMGCNLKMPHDAFADKIKKPDISRDLRLENVYWIDMNAVPVKSRNGG